MYTCHLSCLTTFLTKVIRGRSGLKTGGLKTGGVRPSPVQVKKIVSGFGVAPRRSSNEYTRETRSSKTDR